jgi:two-component system nitrogen regulation sensor histidine kinase NtrY
MPKPQPTDENLIEVLREVLFLMRVAHPDITFEESFAADRIIARIDRRLVAQAVQNLLKNAAEAIAESESVAPGEGRIRVSVPAPTGEQISFDIEDNGKGFPGDNRARLLEPYMTTRAGGTGLGLPIVAKIFEEHGGRIELLDRPPGADGEVPRGALVRVHLPPTAPNDPAKRPATDANRGE